jgi:glucosamine-6-phosphate deaminase
MEVIVRKDAEAAARLTARLIADAIRVKPDLVLGLATGRTMERVYEMLVEEHKYRGLDFTYVVTFNLDEYVGLAPSDPCSYSAYMHYHLFRHVNINPANAHVPRGNAADLEEECRRYEALIAAYGGIDLQLLGIGLTGHIGFNEPMSSLRSRTRLKALSPVTLQQNSEYFGGVDKVPRRAITVGVGNILESKRAIMLATGEEKADIVARALEGPVTAMVTASALQLHPRCVVILDEGAAANLTMRDYYDHIFHTEPEWAPYRSL